MPARLPSELFFKSIHHARSGGASRTLRNTPYTNILTDRLRELNINSGFATAAKANFTINVNRLPSPLRCNGSSL